MPGSQGGDPPSLLVGTRHALTTSAGQAPPRILGVDSFQYQQRRGQQRGTRDAESAVGDDVLAGPEPLDQFAEQRQDGCPRPAPTGPR
jgi:hypothetical protein